jgi:FtsP/CotA-like multicopper oxidase with cupredoxin domain
VSALLVVALLGGLQAQGGPLPGLVAEALAGPCPAGAPLRHYAATAVGLPVSYNAWGDFDPLGQLLVPDEELPALLADVAGKLAQAGQAGLSAAVAALASDLAAGDPQEAAAALQARLDAFAADLARTPAQVGARDAVVENVLGLASPRLAPSPLARPYVVRAHLGDCVEVRVLNLLAAPVGLHAHGLQTEPGQGMALGTQAPDYAMPGTAVPFRFFVPDLPGMEGAHFLHSHADARRQTSHGLFGAIVAEPRHTRWLTPAGTPATSGPEAIVADPHGADFREFVVLYHDEALLYTHLLKPMPILGTHSNEYGPGTKAVNLRTEPFHDRKAFAEAAFAANRTDRPYDKSLALSSYAYGDPATFLPRAYLGDPTKFRLVNAGPGQGHVHHLHGGGDRWRHDPHTDDTQFDDGLVKANPHVQSDSRRVDVQDLAPGDAFTAEIEGGAGGVQQSVGDFLYHCHIVEHYLAGMWGIWRVHNTRQPGLAPLPDRVPPPRAVDSKGLLGRTMPDGTLLTATNLKPWVEAHLPPQGVPAPGEAAVWDWAWKGLTALGEPGDPVAWPNHAASASSRPAVGFDPRDGRLAYPFLEPHLAKRPPFAPGHGPAPHLGPGGPDALCPASARGIAYDVVAMPTAVAYDSTHADPNGRVFALAEDVAAIASGTKPATSLNIRANQGDCVDVLLTSRLDEKVNMHIHLVQFDVQGSDGVVTGHNYEQSVRPATATGTALAAAVAPGATTVTLADPAAVRVGTLVGIGLTGPGAEIRKVLAVTGATATLDAPLAQAHPAGARVGAEFVRYRWFADVELGMVYWHDHVDGLHSWAHGLFGGLVVEPNGSQWCRPDRPAAALADCTGWTMAEGHVADIVASHAAHMAAGDHTFREMVLQFQDRACTPSCTSGGPFPLVPSRFGEPAAFNLRSAPLRSRAVADPFLSDALADGVPQGDPQTPMLVAHAGDPTTLRLLYAGQTMSRGLATFGVTGHRFTLGHHDPAAQPLDTLSLGISDQHSLVLECGAGGCLGTPGDYLYGMTQPEVRDRGAWGILRVLPNGTAGVAPLPSNRAPAPVAAGPVRAYDVVALRVPVTLNQRLGLTATMDIYALASDEAAILAGTLRPEPLVLRMAAGERLTVNLANHLPIPVAFHAGLLLPETAADLGIRVGDTNGTTVPPGGTATYQYRADRELGIARVSSHAALQTPFAATDPSLRGLYGAIVVEPAGAAFAPATGTHATLTLADGTQATEHVLLYASNDPLYDASAMSYKRQVGGNTMVNYRTEPLQAFLVDGCAQDPNACTLQLAQLDVRHPALPFAQALREPETPVLLATRGQPLVVRTLGGAGDQLAAHGIDGHWWADDALQPGCRPLGPACGRNLAATTPLGPGEAHNAWIPAAGPGGAGDYLWGNQRLAFQEAGAWGVLRVVG